MLPNVLMAPDLVRYEMTGGWNGWKFDPQFVGAGGTNWDSMPGSLVAIAPARSGRGGGGWKDGMSQPLLIKVEKIGNRLLPLRTAPFYPRSCGDRNGAASK